LPCLTYGQLHRKGRAVLAPPDHLAAGADDLPLARAPKMIEVLIVLLAIRARHQHLDVLANHLAGGVLEQSFASRVEHQHATAHVNQDDAVNRGFHHGLQPCRFRILRDLDPGSIRQRL
jgi:hypothetical protein